MDKPQETGRVIREFLAGEPPEALSQAATVDGSMREVAPVGRILTIANIGR
jgi:hypothetical protein